MANNRMYLVFRPTGDCVFLGKRLAEGWYGTPADLCERIEALFEKVMDRPEGASQDDFAIALEQGQNQPHVIRDWQYDRNKDPMTPTTNLIVSDTVPRGTPEGI